MKPNKNGLRNLVIGAGMIIYVLMIFYTEYHSIVLMLKGVTGDGKYIAWGGLVCLGLTAIFLPIALKVWTFDSTQRVAAFIFYGAALLIGLSNTIVNFNTQSGQRLPGWANEYVTWIVPITPIICGLGWAVLFMLDPTSKARIKQATNELQSELLYHEARAKYAEEDAVYRAEITRKAELDQLAEGRRQFGITAQLEAPKKRETNPIIGSIVEPDSDQIRMNKDGESPFLGTARIAKNGARK